MSRVLLFVQSESAPQPTVTPTTAIQRETLLRGGPGGKGSAIGTLVHVNWWLVECENAAVGRGCIYLWQREKGRRTTFADDVFCDEGVFEARGRILAHGSREPREAAK